MKALRVFESPDEISWPNLTYNQYGEPVDSNEWAPEFGATGSHAFWYENGEFVMGNEHGGHPLEVLRDKESYSGRVWADQKLISFWYYPSKFQFQDIAKELSEKLSRKRGEDINILEDPEWKVEILPENKKWHSQDPYVRDAAEKTWKTELVPAGEYGGSAQRSEEDLGQEHAKSPMLKKLSRAKVGGSKKYGKEKPLAWRQALVPESLEEALDFERGNDPKKSMNIGKHRKFQIGDKIEVYNALYDDYWDAIVSDIWDQEGDYTITAEIPEIEGHYPIIFNEDFGEWMIDE